MKLALKIIATLKGSRVGSSHLADLVRQRPNDVVQIRLDDLLSERPKRSHEETFREEWVRPIERWRIPSELGDDDDLDWSRWTSSSGTRTRDSDQETLPLTAYIQATAWVKRTIQNPINSLFLLLALLLSSIVLINCEPKSVGKLLMNPSNARARTPKYSVLNVPL